MNMDIINAVDGAKSSARFERENLMNVDTFKKRKHLFEHALSLAPDEGLLMEFGTYRGDSINQLAKLRPKKRFHGFDSFVGLPEAWAGGVRKGAFSTQGKLPRVRRNVQLVQGFFEDSLPGFIEGCNDDPVAFVHVDCDLYSSTMTVLNLLKPRYVVGTVLVFDEYYNYSDWLLGEYKAWLEFCDEWSVEFKYIGYIRMGSQVAVQITAL